MLGFLSDVGYMWRGQLKGSGRRGTEPQISSERTCQAGWRGGLTGFSAAATHVQRRNNGSEKWSAASSLFLISLLMIILHV